MLEEFFVLQTMVCKADDSPTTLEFVVILVALLGAVMQILNRISGKTSTVNANLELTNSLLRHVVLVIYFLHLLPLKYRLSSCILYVGYASLNLSWTSVSQLLAVIIMCMSFVVSLDFESKLTSGNDGFKTPWWILVVVSFQYGIRNFKIDPTFGKDVIKTTELLFASARIVLLFLLLFVSQDNSFMCHKVNMHSTRQWYEEHAKTTDQGVLSILHGASILLWVCTINPSIVKLKPEQFESAIVNLGFAVTVGFTITMFSTSNQYYIWVGVSVVSNIIDFLSHLPFIANAFVQEEVEN